jgi:hypothetical protein
MPMPSHENRNAGRQPGVGGGGSVIQWKLPDTEPRRSLQAVFTARPLGTHWSVAAIAATGEAVQLGIFPHRREALSAAAVMAGACGGTFVP